MLVSLSAGASKLGDEEKARAPVDELMVKSAASVPEIDQVSVVPESTSEPAKVATLELPSA